MPDAQLAAGLIGTARQLVSASSKRPKEANLRCSISACYYAVFHCLAKLAADSLIGKTPGKRPNKAWVEVYRGLNHGTCHAACRDAANINFPREIKDFAENFVQLQDIRHQADYDPKFRPTKRDAEFYIALAEKSVSEIENVAMVDKKAFSAWILITSRGAKKARQESLKASRAKTNGP